MLLRANGTELGIGSCFPAGFLGIEEGFGFGGGHLLGGGRGEIDGGEGDGGRIDLLRRRRVVQEGLLLRDESVTQSSLATSPRRVAAEQRRELVALCEGRASRLLLVVVEGVERRGGGWGYGRKRIDGSSRHGRGRAKARDGCEELVLWCSYRVVLCSWQCSEGFRQTQAVRRRQVRLRGLRGRLAGARVERHGVVDDGSSRVGGTKDALEGGCWGYKARPLGFAECMQADGPPDVGGRPGTAGLGGLRRARMQLHGRRGWVGGRTLYTVVFCCSQWALSSLLLYCCSQ